MASPTGAALSIVANRGFLPCSYTTSYDSEGDDSDHELSDDDSSGSSGTVKMSALSAIEWPVGDNANQSEDRGCSAVPSTPSSRPQMYENEATSAEKILLRTPSSQTLCSADVGIAAGSTPSSHSNKEAAQRSVRWSSVAETYGPGHRLGFKAIQSLPDLRNAAPHTRHKTMRPAHVGSIHQIDTWETAVKICTVITLSGSGTVQVHHHAQLSVITPNQDICATQIRLCLAVTNGLQGDHTRRLEAGQSSLSFNEKICKPQSSQLHEAEINIIRNICDKDKALDVYFTFAYPSPDRNVVASIPTFRPRKGRLISESVFIAEPLPPLVMTTLTRSQYSTWKSKKNTLHQVEHLERIEMSALYPEGLKDDIRIKIMELPPVHFTSLGEMAAIDVVWAFDIKVQRVFGVGLECHMSLSVEIGLANSVLTLNSHGWTPQYCLINGRLTTQKAGEWRQQDGKMTLFRQHNMSSGPFKVEIYWHQPPNMDELNGSSPFEILLPRVIDREVLGGSLVCRDMGGAFLTNPGAKDSSHSFFLGPDTRLPVLHREYRLYLNRTPSGPEPDHSFVSEDNEPSEPSNTHSSANREPDECAHCTHITNHAGQNSGHHKHSLASVIKAIAASVLILALALGIGHLGKGTRPMQGVILAGFHVPVVEDYETPGGKVMDLALDAASELVITGATSDDDREGQREGLRDRIDRALGWKGYNA